MLLVSRKNFRKTDRQAPQGHFTFAHQRAGREGFAYGTGVEPATDPDFSRLLYPTELSSIARFPTELAEHVKEHPVRAAFIRDLRLLFDDEVFPVVDVVSVFNGVTNRHGPGFKRTADQSQTGFCGSSCGFLPVDVPVGNHAVFPAIFSAA